MNNTDPALNDFRLTKRKKDGICQAILTCMPAKTGLLPLLFSTVQPPLAHLHPKAAGCPTISEAKGVGDHGPWAGCNARGVVGSALTESGDITGDL